LFKAWFPEFVVNMAGVDDYMRAFPLQDMSKKIRVAVVSPALPEKTRKVICYFE
jgi:hypothetical protein